MPPKEPKPHATWDSASEKILIDQLKKAFDDAKGGDNNFKPQVYSDVSAALNTANYTLDATQVKNRWTRFKTQWKTGNHLRGLSGFGWDDLRKCVTATEDVWNALLFDKDGAKKKKYNEYNWYRTNSFPLYDNIADLIEGNTAVGNHTFLSTSGPSAAPTHDTPDEDPDITDDTQQPISPQLDATLSRSVSPSVLDPEPTRNFIYEQRRPATPPSTPAPKRIKSTSTNQLAQLNDTLDRTLERLADALESPEPSSTVAESISPLRKQAWNLVKAEEGLSPHSLARARRVFRDVAPIKDIRKTPGT
ncbi:hypothetical protein OF83DRAFT_1178421 [Amylostereum chailletii]|nr:hypothetical protein OF83DRAFT_1178421 [Amylostereum chailletii]